MEQDKRVEDKKARFILLITQVVLWFMVMVMEMVVLIVKQINVSEHMLFQVLCGFEPLFYPTHPNEESYFLIYPYKYLRYFFVAFQCAPDYQAQHQNYLIIKD